MQMTGYLHKEYAESFSELGNLMDLPRAKGWIIKRRIPGFSSYDAMGCYPLFLCSDWSKLKPDLDALNGEVISLSLVADPFGDYDTKYLRCCFKDIVIPFKEHFVIELGQPLETFVSAHHRRYAQTALKELHVERCFDPTAFSKDWVKLYKNLIVRHNIRGIAAFSKESLAKQLCVPGAVAFRAIEEGKTIGMLLWYRQNNVAYYHLGAYGNKGYVMRASFALFWFAINYFTTLGLRWLSLGAGVGVRNDSTDGLSRFKRGWSTGTRTAYFCGRIFNEDIYNEIVASTRVLETDYFPAYRKDEFI